MAVTVRSEASVQRSFIRAVKAAGGWSLKLRGPRGWPDLLVIWPSGQIDFVELKAPGKKPRASQVSMHKKLLVRHHRVRVIDSIEAVGDYIFHA